MNIASAPLFSFAWFPDFDRSLYELSQLAMRENWDYSSKPNGRLPILCNYIHHTFAKLESENKIEREEHYCSFNTGLVTENQEEVFAYFEKNKRRFSSLNWYFIGWRKKSDRVLMKFKNLPDVANYFSNPAELIYDCRLDFRINVDHIISDNRDRFPASLSNMASHQLGNLLCGTIEDAKRRVRRNYKTAIPQFYKGKLQLLLPLCLLDRSKADLALVVEKENNTYRASTILTLLMAINNARLIARPDDEWLKI